MISQHTDTLFMKLFYFSFFSFASQRQNAKDKENKKKGIKKKDATLAMLAPDLLEVDPHVSHRLRS